MESNGRERGAYRGHTHRRIIYQFKSLFSDSGGPCSLEEVGNLSVNRSWSVCIWNLDFSFFRYTWAEGCQEHMIGREDEAGALEVRCFPVSESVPLFVLWALLTHTSPCHGFFSLRRSSSAALSVGGKCGAWNDPCEWSLLSAFL